MTVRRVDGLQAGEWSTGQRGQQFLPADLGRVVVERGQHPVDQTDPVPGSPALDEARLPRPVRDPGRTGRRVTRYERGGDQGVQPPGIERTGAEQVQVGQHPDRRVGQNRQCGDAAVGGRGPDPQGEGPVVPVPGRDEVQDQSPPGAEPYGDGPGGPRLGAEQDPGLVAPPVDGTVVPGWEHPPQFRVFRAPVVGRPSGPGPGPQLVGPAGVPQVAVQVEAEPPFGAGAGARITAGAGSVPQREADPLTGVRPGRSGPGDEVDPTCPRPRPALLRDLVPGQREGQVRAQQPVGSDARHVPAQQVGRQMPEIGPDPGREVVAVRARHGTQIEIDIHACGGAGPGPVPDGTAGGRGLDHGRRHGVLAYAQPEGKAGIPIRGLSEHQHSPCADGTPICEQNEWSSR